MENDEIPKSDDQELLDLLSEIKDPSEISSLPEDDEYLEEPEEDKPTEIIKDNAVEATIVEEEEEESQGQKFAKEILSKYSHLYGKLIERSTSDEKEIQEVLEFLKDKVFTDQAVEEHYVMALSQTIQTKTNATTNTVRLLDNIVKLISAGKGSSLLGEQKSSATADMVKLAQILKSEKYEDER